MNESARSVDDLTAEWTTRVLRAAGTIGATTAVEGVSSQVIGAGQLGHVVRLELRYADGAPDQAPASLVVKLASESEKSRATGVAMGAYEREVRFYAELAGTLDVAVPRCHLAAFDPAEGWFTLVFDDLSETAEVGDMRTGGTADQASLALTELAKLHAPRWGSPSLERLAWLADPAPARMLFASVAGSTETFLTELGPSLTPEQATLIERTAPLALDWWREWTAPFVIQHGDYRMDNMLFGTAPGAPPVTVVDWQWMRLGPAAVDLGFYLGGCLPRDVRREVERDLLADYHGELRARGVEGYGLEQLWDDYRRCSLYGLFIVVGAYANHEHTEVLRALTEAFVRQYADLALDLSVAELIAT